MDQFLQSIKDAGQICPAMALRPPHNKLFVPKFLEISNKIRINDDDPIRFVLLLINVETVCNPMNFQKSLEELRSIATNIALNYSDDDIAYIEEKTRTQSSCDLWYRLRAFRITASNFKTVCRTSVLHPSVSLIKQICYPEKYVFSNSAVNYGWDNESTALNRYFKKMAKIHDNLTIKTVGLIINNAFPHIGASPDAIVHCDCCGKGSVEVKCPYTLHLPPTLNVIQKIPSSPLITKMWCLK